MNRSRNRKYKSYLDITEKCLNKELDLGKFFFRQRVVITALLGILKGHQTAFIDKMSRVKFLQYNTMSSDSEIN